MPVKRGAGLTITVKLIRARKLAAKDLNGKSDPYAVVQLGTVSKRSKVVQANLNPTWNVSFEFVGSRSEPITNKSILRIALYDEDRLTADDFLGEIIIPVGFLTANDEKPQWKTLEVRPGADEFVSGDVQVAITKSGEADEAEAAPTAKKAKTTEHDEIGLLPQYVVDPTELDFAKGKPLGQGAFGTVRAATFRGLPVAVKTMILAKDADRAAKLESINDFKLEVEIMSKISHHPKLCLFLGASIVEPLTVVTEMMTGGSAKSVLVKSAKPGAPPLTYERRVEIALDGALGLAFLHRCEPPVLHRDLKCDNLLIDEHGSAKLADFGFTKTMEGTDAPEHEILGTPGFMAPEMYTADEEGAYGYEAPADIFAYGMAMFEMLTMGGWPFGDEADAEDIEQYVIKGTPPSAPKDAPKIPKDAPDGFVKLHSSCIALKPEKRPDAAAMVSALKAELEKLRKKSSTSSGGGASTGAAGKKKKK